mgnify:CR=1 FL=1
MERINIKIIAYLSAALAFLAGYFFLYEVRKKNPWENKEQIFQFKSEDIERINIYGKEGKGILCKREDEQWFITEPVFDRADNKIIQKIISTLEQARVIELVEKKSSDLSQFGLTGPGAIRVEVKTKQGKEEKIIIGDPVPLNTLYVYAKIEEKEEIFTTYSDVREAFDKAPFDLIDKTVLFMNPDKIKKIKMSTVSLNITLEKDQNRWQITRPIKTLADGEKIKNLLQTLEKTRAKQFIRENLDNLKLFGLDNPQIQISFWRKDDKTPLILWVGNKEKGKMFYARNNIGNKIFLIDKSIIESIPERIEDIQEMHALIFDVDKINRMEIAYPHLQIVMDREDEKIWKIISPISTRADEIMVKKILWEIKDIKAKRFFPESFLKNSELEKPEISIVLWEKEKVYHLNIFSSKTLDKKIFAQSTLHNLFFTVKSEVKKSLTVTPFGIRDKHLLIFNPVEVEKFRLRYEDTLIQCEKKGRQWKITKPFVSLANGPKIWRILFSIKDLEFKQVLKEKIDDPLKYSLKTPWLQITLWKKGEEEIGSIKVGKPLNEKLIFATSTLLGGVYAIDFDLLKELPKNASEIEYKR